jgi:hypothetical protein
MITEELLQGIAIILMSMNLTLFIIAAILFYLYKMKNK